MTDAIVIPFPAALLPRAEAALGSSLPGVASVTELPKRGIAAWIAMWSADASLARDRAALGNIVTSILDHAGISAARRALEDQLARIARLQEPTP